MRAHSLPLLLCALLLATASLAAPPPGPDRTKVLIGWIDGRNDKVPIRGADIGGEGRIS